MHTNMSSSFESRFNFSPILRLNLGIRKKNARRGVRLALCRKVSSDTIAGHSWEGAPTLRQSDNQIAPSQWNSGTADSVGHILHTR
ncbi:MAG: hypothetical protein UY03_C0015G0026 [Parcubacteria group bacterium GW2011_GWA2_47_64]|nr:MAG: hypothetical protein UY03_C0015G0026 [Parcubacteria group bacterium GW2011_GWA2_47_64]KKU97259.1 MAG: hypothetical protein UY29_C0001G0053 [Parcubacteria group bacterium GW2011_GWC2_48_17]